MSKAARYLQIRIGDVFSMLTIIDDNPIIKKEKNGPNVKLYKCKCECGNIVDVRKYSLLSGKTKACGCYQKVHPSNYKHGLKDDPLYSVWQDIRKRTSNPKQWNYKYYGGKGIKISQEWNDFQCFYNDMHKTYESGLNIDRIDNDGDYCKENCRWVSHQENCRNRSSNVSFTYNGIEFNSIMQFCEYYDLKPNRIYSLYFKYGNDIKKAISRTEFAYKEKV